ncbi:MAG: EAL domain-containing protein [Microcystaceae cyanobacterium]
MNTILIIEDETAIRELICEMLEIHSFDTLEAANGQQGIQIAQQKSPDLILCDIMMPKMDGYEVLNILQNQVETATIPFIFLTAKGEATYIKQGLQLGADDYLVKPFTEKDLIHSINLRLKKKENLKGLYQQQLNELKSQLNYSLTHDPLTNLPNHIALREIFSQEIKQCQSNQKIPIISLSLDRFHWVNQTLGYTQGDQLIHLAIERMVHQLDNHTSLIRLNGIKFAIISHPVEQLSSIFELGNKILQQFEYPFQVGQQKVFLSVSMGMAVYPYDDDTLESLLQKANQVRQWIKQRGGNQFQAYQIIFPPQPKINYLELELELRHALEKQQLSVYYQPQFNTRTHQIIGAEALLRWYHPAKGFISPAVFIPIAETTGLIEPIGQWILKTVCQQNEIWQHKHLGNIRVAVNLSARQFNQPSIVSLLEELLEHITFDRELLELELTESILVENINHSIERLSQIKALGLKIAIDDFGTGYSSLSYLQNLPFDILKIDQCFIRNIHKNPQNAAITATLITMAHQLGLRVIAEGVETTEELTFLEQHHCDEIQGYLFSRPLPLSDFEQLLSVNSEQLAVNS